jgi:hypothetical protein
MIVLVLFLLLLLLTSLYVIYNLNRKYSQLEEVSQDNVEFILALRSRVLSQQSYLKQLDRRGAFEADDEVGVVFKEIKKIINDIALYLEFEKDVDNDDENNVRGTIERF